MLVLFISAFAWRFNRCNYRNYYQPLLYGQELLESSPDDSIIIADKSNSAFILIYLKYCRNATKARIITPSPALTSALADLSDSDKDISSCGKGVLSMLRSNYELYSSPILRKQELDSITEPVVIFTRCADIWRLVTPAGIVFKMDHEQHYSKDVQFAFWRDLLERPGFKFTNDDKPDFSLNMEDILFDHAFWHMLREEYDIAKFLLVNAEKHSKEAPSDVDGCLAQCMLELGETEDALRVATHALMKNGADKRAIMVIARALMTQGDHLQAIDILQSVLNIYPDDTEAQKYIAIAREQLTGQ